MEDEIFLENIKYISSKRLSKISGYSHDYISRLCREDKIDGKLLGRNWFVDPRSLSQYKEVSRENQKDLLTHKLGNNSSEKNNSTDNWEELIFSEPREKEKIEEKNTDNGMTTVTLKKDMFLNTISSKRDSKKNKNITDGKIFSTTLKKRLLTKISIYFFVFSLLLFAIYKISFFDEFARSTISLILEEKIIVENLR